MNDQNQQQPAASQIGQGINELSDAVEGAMVEVSAQVGKATIEMSKTMVSSAREITNASQQFVRASGKLALAKASQKFEGLLEEATLEHLEGLAKKRAKFEETARDLPAGAAKRFALRMIEKISDEEESIVSIAMEGGGLSLLSGELESPTLATPHGPSGNLMVGTRGKAFAPPLNNSEVEDEVMPDPIISEGIEAFDRADHQIQPGDSAAIGQGQAVSSDT